MLQHNWLGLNKIDLVTTTCQRYVPLDATLAGKALKIAHCRVPGCLGWGHLKNRNKCYHRSLGACPVWAHMKKLNSDAPYPELVPKHVDINNQPYPTFSQLVQGNSPLMSGIGQIPQGNSARQMSGIDQVSQGNTPHQMSGIGQISQGNSPHQMSGIGQISQGNSPQQMAGIGQISQGNSPHQMSGIGQISQGNSPHQMSGNQAIRFHPFFPQMLRTHPTMAGIPQIVSQGLPQMFPPHPSMIPHHLLRFPFFGIPGIPPQNPAMIPTNEDIQSGESTPVNPFTPSPPPSDKEKKFESQLQSQYINESEENSEKKCGAQLQTQLIDESEENGEKKCGAQLQNESTFDGSEETDTSHDS